ncbi:MAG: hypothetical protein EU544_03960 [Promethearchaeota archaeon]|nr:MAG: hypothetical protein EU544_03960 [Candidatus Lokiarchaeota archaeon]
MVKHVLKYMEAFPSELEEMVQTNPIAYVPFGALEWHSLHMVCGVDSLKATQICRRSAEMTGGVLFPCVNWGAFSTMRFPFTFHFSKRRLKRMTKQILDQLYHMGFRILILLTGHYPGAQIKQVRKAAQKISKKYNDCYALGIPEQALVADLEYLGDHAAKWETSLMLAINEGYVRLEDAPDGLSFSERAARYGIMGRDPKSEASSQKGEKILDAIVSRLAEAISRVRRTQSIEPFEEIYARYQKELKKLRSPDLSYLFKIQGIEGFGELKSFLKWWILNGKRYKPSNPNNE